MRRPAASPMIFAALLGASLLSACGADPGAAAPRATTVTTPVTATITTPVTTEVAPSALQFTADLVAGGTVDFRSYTGKTLALWFWAPT